MSKRSREYIAGVMAETNHDQLGGQANSSGLGWASGIKNKDQARSAFNSAEAISDIMEYYYERDGKTFANADEARDYFISDRRYRGMNSFGLGGEMIGLAGAEDQQKLRLARLQTLFDNLPDFYEEGGDGWKGFAANAGYALLDPVNLIGFGSGAAAAKAAAAGVRAASTKALTQSALSEVKREAVKKGLAAGAYKGARNEAIVGGAVEGGFNIGEQNRNMQIGLQDEFSYSQLGKAVGVGSIFSGALGAGFGLAGAANPYNMKFGVIPTKGKEGLLGSATNKASSKGFMPAPVKQGIMQEQSAMRAANNEARIDPSAAIGRGLDTDVSAQEAEMDGKRQLAEQIEGIAARLDEEPTDTNAGARVDGNTVKITADPDKVELSQASRLRTAADQMIILEESAQRLEREASDPELDAKARTDKMAQARRHRQVSNAIEASFNNLLGNNKAANATEQMDKLGRHSEEATKLLELKETPEGQPTTRITGQASAADANIPVRNADAEANAPQEAELKALQEQYEQRLDDVTDEAEAETLRANIEEIKKARVSGVIPENIPLLERPANIGKDLEARAESTKSEIAKAKARGTEAQAELKQARDNYAKAKQDGAEEAALAELQKKGEDAKARLDTANSELSQLGRDLDGIETQIKARKSEAVAPEAEGAPTQDVEADPTIGTSTPDSPDRVLEVVGNDTNRMVDALVEMGDDPKVAKRKLKSFGDGRNPQTKIKQREYLRERVEQFVARDHLFMVLDNMFGGMDDVQSMNMKAVVTAIKQTVPENLQELALAHYDLYATNRSKQLLVNMMADGLDVADALDEIRIKFGDDAMTMAAQNLNPAVQKAGIPGKNGDNLDKLLSVLSEENRVLIRDGLIASTRNLMEKMGMSEADAIAMARDVQAEKAERMIAASPEILTRDIGMMSRDQQALTTDILSLKSLRSQLLDLKSNGKIREKAKFARDDVTTYHVDWENFTMQKEGQKMRLFFDPSGEPTADELRYLRVRAEISAIGAKHGFTGKSLGEIIAQLEKRAEGIGASIKKGATVTLDVRQLQTRGTRDFSVHDEFSNNAPHIGAQQRKGLGTYTVFGKEREGGSIIKRPQGSLKASHRGMNDGGVWQSIKTTDVNGQVRRLSRLITAHKQMADASIARATNRMTVDPIKQGRNAEKLDPLLAIQKELKSLDGKIRAAKKKVKEFDGVDPTEVENKLYALEKERSDLLATVEENLIDTALIRQNEVRVRETVTDSATGQPMEIGTGVLDKEATARKALNQNIALLSRSTEKEAAGNRAEVAKETAVITAARGKLIQLEKEIQRMAARLENGEEINRFKLDKMLDDANKLRQQLETGTATEKAVFADSKNAALVENLTQEALEQDGMVTTKTDLDGSEIPAEVVQKAEKNADEIARQDGIKALVAKFMNENALPDLSDEQMAAVVKQAVEMAKAMKANKVAPDTTPAEVKNNPAIVVVDLGEGRAVEVDVTNDFTFSKNMLSDDLTDISFFGDKVGTVKKTTQWGYTYEGTDGLAMSFYGKGEFLKFLAVRHKDRIRAKQDAEPYFDEVPSSGSSYTMPNHEVTQTYKGAPQKPKIEAVDPVDNPARPFDPENPLTARATSFDIPAGRWPAVQILGNGKQRGKVRPFNLNDKQTVQDVLGKQEEYVLGFVDYGAKGVEAMSTFRPMNEAEHFIPMGMTETVRADEFNPTKAELSRSSPRQRKVRPKKLEDLANTIIEEATPAMRERGIRTAADLHDYIVEMDNMDWNTLGTVEEYQAWVTTRYEASALLRRYAPNGVEKPTSNVRSSISTLHNVLGNASPEELQSVEDILVRLAYSNEGVAPTFRSAENIKNVNSAYAMNTSYQYKELRNKILIDGNILNDVEGTGERHLPSSALVLHELGHWIYGTLLDEGDKLKFWGAIGKYIDEDGVNIDMLQKRANMGDADGIDVFDNDMKSPAEFFANQFMAWAVTNRQVGDVGLWSKVSKIAHALIKRIRGDEFQLDEDLVPIFQRYLPELDIDPVTGGSNGGISRFAGLQEVAQKIARNPERASYIAERLETLDNQRVELISALRHINANPNDTIELGKVLEKTHKSLYRFYGGKAGDRTHKDGTTRDTILDGSSARNAIYKAQKNAKEFLDTLRAGKDKNDARLTEIMQSQEGDFQTEGVDAATMRILQAGDYSDVEAAQALHMRKLANEMVFAINQGIRKYRTEFSNSLPKTARHESVVLNDDGSAYLGQPSEKSLRFMKQYNQAQREQANKSARALLEAINKRKASIYTDAMESGDPELGMSPKSMSDDALSNKLLATKEETVQHVNLVNERINKANTEPAQVDLNDLNTEEHQAVQRLTEMSDNELRSMYRKSVQENSPKFVQIITQILKSRGHDNPKLIESSRAAKLVNDIVEKSAGDSDGIGIYPHISETLKEQVEAVTHRDKRKMVVARELMQRMATLTGEDVGENVGVTQYGAMVMQGHPADDFDDVVALNLDDELYQGLRDNMRTLANLAAKDAPELIGRLARFSYHLQTPSERRLLVDAMIQDGKQPRNSEDVLKELDRLIEFHIRGSVPFEDMLGLPEWQGTPTLTKMLHNILDDVAVLSNGLIDDPIHKNMYQFAAYGDVFASQRSKSPMVDAAHSIRDDVVHPVVAVKYGRELADNMPLAQEMAIRTWGGIRMEEPLSKRIMYNVSPEGQVRGVTPSFGEYGTGVYITKGSQLNNSYDPEIFVNRLINRAKQLGVNGEDMRSVKAAAQHIASLRTDIERMMNARNPDHRGIRVRLRQEANMWNLLQNINKSFYDQKVAPVFTRSRATLSFNSKSKYTIAGEQKNNIAYLIQDMANTGMINDKGVNALLNVFQGEFNGRQLYAALTNDEFGVLHLHGNSIDGNDAKNKLNLYLQKSGMDAIETDEGYVFFDPDNVKHAVRGYNQSDAPQMRTEQMGGDLKVAGAVAEEMFYTGAKYPPTSTPTLATGLQHAGVPAGVMKPLKKMLKQQPIAESDVQKVGKISTILNLFKENSARFRSYGANWFGNTIKPEKGVGFYEKHDVEMSRILSKTFQALDELDDAGNKFERWNKRNKGLLFMEVGQPKSHERIVRALRMGRGEVDRLKPKEKAIALKVASLFADELDNLRALDIPVGDVRSRGTGFYVPQVWDGEAILANPNAFEMAMTNFLIREQNSLDFPAKHRLTRAQINAKVKMLAKRLTDQEGVMDTVDAIKYSVPDAFQKRVINLQPEDVPEMMPFLVNNLQGLMAKYFDRTVRKRLLTEKFGLNGHGVDEYKAVARLGAESAVDIMMSGKHMTTHNDTLGVKVEIEEYPYIHPLKGNRQEIESVLRSVQDELNVPDENKHAAIQRAKNILLNAQEAQFRTQAGYIRRVDAVVNALADFPAGGMSTTAMQRMDEMMNVLNRKPIDGSSGNETKHKVVRNMKSFNSVTLLAFTTLTSVPDLALPLIRSGNMRAFGKAWIKYMSDPVYRQAAKNIGTGIENMLHDRMVHMAGGGSQKFTNSFFNATFLTTWTNFNREMASMVGMEAFKSEIARARKAYMSGNRDGYTYKKAKRFLERYGLTGQNAEHDFLSNSSFMIDEIPANREDVQMQVRAAALRFTNEAIFTPNPNDVPMWAQTPWGSLMFQLKSFPLMMARLSRHVVSEAFVHGNPLPLMYMATAGVGAGAISLGMKDIVQQRGGDDERSAEFRKRSLTNSSEALARAFNVREGSDVDKYAGWYIESLMAMGGLGLFAEFFYNAASQADNGAYGKMRVASAVAGPSFSAVFDSGLTMAAGASDFITGEEKTGNKRAALREMARRVPVAGGISDFREGAADLGGEPGKPGRKGGFGSSPFGKGKFGESPFK